VAERWIGLWDIAGRIGGVLRRHAWIAPLIVLLLAFAVRFHFLERQSLWNDEGNSLSLSDPPPT